MSIPTSEPIFSENDPKITPHHRAPRRSDAPAVGEERSAYLEQVARTLTPGVDFYIFTLVAGVIFILAAWLRSTSLFFLAALLMPFQGPVFGLAWGAVISTGRFLMKQLAGLLLSSVLIFVLGAAGGFVANLFHFNTAPAAMLPFTVFAWPDFIVLAVGAGLGTYSLVRMPRQKPLVASVALAYSLMLPLAAAGFGAGAGQTAFFLDGLLVFAVHLLWAILVGLIVLFSLKQRPANIFGVILSVAIFLLSGVLVAALILISKTPVLVIEPTATPTLISSPTLSITEAPESNPDWTATVPASATPQPTLTASIAPSATPTQTVTPQPTPVWARVNSPSGNGGFVRDEPDGTVLTSLLNGNTVQIVSNPVTGANGSLWVEVITDSGVQGWMVMALLATATPAP
jgi:uncharacterized membrane protein